MARSLRVLAAVLGGWTAAAEAQDTPPSGTPEPPHKHHEPWFQRFHRADGESTPAPPEFENVRRALEALTPEQRKRFQENFLRWANLAPEEKKALRDREELRRKFMEEEVATALRESGLTLEGPRREEFIKRYAEERRKIEERLRQESAERRKPLVRDLVARLKTEFSQPAPAAAPAPGSAAPPAP